MLIAVAARSLASVFGRAFAGISGSNSVGDMDVCFWSKSFSVMLRSLRQADPSFRGVLSNVVCLHVISSNLNNEAVVPRREGVISAINSLVLFCEVEVCVG